MVRGSWVVVGGSWFVLGCLWVVNIYTSFLSCVGVDVRVVVGLVIVGGVIVLVLFRPSFLLLVRTGFVFTYLWRRIETNIYVKKMEGISV